MENGHRVFMDAERAAREKEIDNWLPITASRTAKWWYSAFHNVTAIVGAGVLSLPYGMSALGWGPGIMVLILSWGITLFTMWQMVQMHEISGKRFDRYHELGQRAFGKKRGLWIVVPQQLVVEVGMDIVYMILGGKSLQYFHHLVTEKCMKLTYCTMIFGSVHFVISHLPNFNSISGVSLVAAIMSLSYSTIAWGATLSQGDTVSEGICGNSTTANTSTIDIFRVFSALGSIAFAYAGHNVVLEIQATIPSTLINPSKKPMWKGVIVAYIVVALCYFPVAIIGYMVFGNDVEENILFSLKRPVWLIAMANMFVVIHLVGSYQIYAMPVFDMIEAVLVRKLQLKPSWYLRFITRTTYVGFTLFVAVSLPFFSELMGFFGGFAFAPTTYFLPCMMWLSIYKPKKFGLSWFLNWICIILGVLLMIVAPIGGLKLITDRASNYDFYS